MAKTRLMAEEEEMLYERGMKNEKSTGPSGMGIQEEKCRKGLLTVLKKSNSFLTSSKSGAYNRKIESHSDMQRDQFEMHTIKPSNCLPLGRMALLRQSVSEGEDMIQLCLIIIENIH